MCLLDKIIFHYQKRLIKSLILIIIALTCCCPSIFAQRLDDIDSVKSNQYLEEIFKHSLLPDSATSFFYKSLDELRTISTANEKILARSYTDILDIIYEKEKMQVKKLQTAEEKIRFLKRFWISRDPSPATSVNERLVEHYSRLLYARGQYSWPNQRGYDDRGRIYVQYGPPDDSINDGSSAGALPVISWVYFRLGQATSFDFIDKGLGYEHTTQVTKAIVSPSIIAYISTAEKLVTRRASATPEYMRLHSELLPIFEILRQRPGQLQADPNRYRDLVERAIDTYVINTYRIQAAIPNAVSEFSTGRDTFPLALNLAQFCNMQGQPELVATYGFKIADIKKKTDTLYVKMMTAIRDTLLNTCYSLETTYAFTRNKHQSQDDVINVSVHRLPRNKYFYLLEADNPAGRQHGLRDFAFTLGNYSKDELALSSVILAKNVLAANDSLAGIQSLHRHNLLIFPSPFTTLQRSTPLFFYFEIYNLQRDERGESLYDIAYEVSIANKKSFWASLNPFGKTPGNIIVSETRRGKATTEPTYLQLDFNRLAKGAYNLTVRVTDQAANVTKESTLAFTLED